MKTSILKNSDSFINCVQNFLKYE